MQDLKLPYFQQVARSPQELQGKDLHGCVFAGRWDADGKAVATTEEPKESWILRAQSSRRSEERRMGGKKDMVQGRAAG